MKNRTIVTALTLGFLAFTLSVLPPAPAADTEKAKACENKGPNYHYDPQTERCIKTISKIKPPKTESDESQGEQPDLSQLVQKCGYVHMDYLQGGGAGSQRIPYKCKSPTVTKCGNFNRDTKLAKCCCVAPGYKGKIE